MQEWWSTSPSDIAAYQLAQLRERWKDAVTHIPYYRDLVASGAAPKDFDSIKDYRQSVPILTREIYLSQSAAFARKTAPDGQSMTTGTTGEPIVFGYWRDEAVQHTGINQWVGRMNAGMRADDRLLLLWGHAHLHGQGLTGWVHEHTRRLKDKLAAYRRLNAYKMDPASAETYYRSMCEFKPGAVLGYAAALDLWARIIGQDGRRAPKGIHVCIACVEMFPHHDSRERISEFLGCPVVMEYGGVDFGVCAYEHGRGPGYRVFWWSHLMETEEEQGEGNLIVTGLTPRYLPLFRYSNRDRCTGAKLRDDGTFIEFERILGRRTENDTYRFADGTGFGIESLLSIVTEGDGIRFIQAVIDPKDVLRIRIVASDWPDDTAQRVRARLASVHPALGTCAIEVAEDALTNRAGKRWWLVQE